MNSYWYVKCVHLSTDLSIQWPHDYSIHYTLNISDGYSFSIHFFFVIFAVFMPLAYESMAVQMPKINIGIYKYGLLIIRDVFIAKSSLFRCKMYINVTNKGKETRRQNETYSYSKLRYGSYTEYWLESRLLCPFTHLIFEIINNLMCVVPCVLCLYWILNTCHIKLTNLMILLRWQDSISCLWCGQAPFSEIGSTWCFQLIW